MPSVPLAPAPSASAQISLPNHYIGQLLRLLQSRGVDTASLLQQLGMTPALLEQTDAPVSWPQFYRLIQQSKALSNEPALGLYLGSQLTISTHGLLGMAALSSDSLEQALQLVCRYITTRSPLISLHISKQANQTVLRLTELYPLADIAPFIAETVLVTLHQVLQVLSASQYQPSAVQFAFTAPAYQALYPVFFACPVHFGRAGHAIIFNNAYLAIKPPLADSIVRQQLSEQCEQALVRQRQCQTLAGAIQLLLGRTKGRIPDINQVAAEFSMSERTLRRRLHDEQTSYQQLVAAWRLQMARHYLTHTALPVQQIAYLLGYADAANFGRAFRQRCNISPRQFRQRYALTQKILTFTSLNS